MSQREQICKYEVPQIGKALLNLTTYKFYRKLRRRLIPTLTIMALFLGIFGALVPTVLGSHVDGLNFPFDYSDHPQPFKISVDHQFIDQTIQKAGLYRSSIPVKQYPEWNDGPPPQKMKAIAKHWATKYDWFSIQDEINKNFSHYTTSVSGSRNYQHTIPLHFIHEKSSRDDAIPLLLLHGWPSSHLEWSQVIPLLTSPMKPSHPAFHVVAPDLPGYGFSPAPQYSGQGPQEVGDAVDQLMKQLHYDTYGLVTTDLGYFVGSWMVKGHSDSIIGHMSDFTLVTPNATDQARFAANETTPEETRYMKALNAYQTMNSAYSLTQRTRPMSAALAMTDSPVGFLGWIWQFINLASDGFDYTVDDLITSTMMLWIQGSFGNMRSYKEYWTVGGLLMDHTSRYITDFE